jgi:hypothetical protein
MRARNVGSPALEEEIALRLTVLNLLIPAALLAACATPPRWPTEGPAIVPLTSTRPPFLAATCNAPDGTIVPLTLLFDTGAEELALAPGVMKRLGLATAWFPRLNYVQGLAREQGGVGRQLAFDRRLPSIELASGLRLEDLRAIPIAMAAPRDGAIGPSSFPGRAVVIDPAHGQLVFVPRTEADALASEEGARALPAVRRGNLLAVPVSLGGAEPVLMTLDTGAGDSFVTPDLVPQAPGGEYVTLEATIGVLSLGPRSFRVERGAPFLSLGADLLASLGRPILFDLEGERVVLLPRGDPHAGAPTRERAR